MNIDITAALLVLRPNSSFSVIGNDYSGIKWYSKDSKVPTEEEVNNKITKGCGMHVNATCSPGN